MRKKTNAFLLTCLVFTIVAGFASAQADTAKKYIADADASLELAMAVKRAGAEGKHVLLQIGGTWCKWCIRFDRFCKGDATIDSLLHAGFISLHINYSKEHPNLDFLASMDFPQRFGFPVFVIVDDKGKRLHTQNSWYLEDGKDSYDTEKVISFLKDWTADALRPEQYKKSK